VSLSVSEKSEGQPVATTRKEERVLGVVARLLYWLSENDASYAPAYGNLLLPLMQRHSMQPLPPKRARVNRLSRLSQNVLTVSQPIMTVVQITDGQVQASSTPAVSEIGYGQGSSHICSSCVREERGPTGRQVHALGGDDGKSNPRTRVNAPRK
jgi:hypothetical protein